MMTALVGERRWRMVPGLPASLGVLRGVGGWGAPAQAERILPSAGECGLVAGYLPTASGKAAGEIISGA